jgi:hypothetical protein
MPLSSIKATYFRGTTMRALIVCAIIITTAVGLGGCFHHAQAVTQQPLKLG